MVSIEIISLSLVFLFQIISNSLSVNWIHGIFFFTYFFAVGNNLLTNCEGMTRHGPSVYVDFYLINRPCTCIVTPSFVGEIIVTSREVTVQMCNTEIVVQKSVLYGCPIPNFSSQTLTVQFNQSVEVRADYVSPSTSGTFYNCMGFQQNGMEFNSIVICTINCSF